MEQNVNALLHATLTTLQAVTDKHGEDVVVPLLTQLRELLLPLMEQPAEECRKVANALEFVAIERRRITLEAGE